MPILPFIRYIGIGVIKLYLFLGARSNFHCANRLAGRGRIRYNFFS